MDGEFESLFRRRLEYLVAAQVPWDGGPRFLRLEVELGNGDVEQKPEKMDLYIS